MASGSESRSKRKLVFSNEDKNKKKASGTLWSEEDDISLLKGMADYESLNHSCPYDDMGMFLDFVKPSLHFDVQRKQLTDRLWRLKYRFLNSAYDLSKPHHAKLFELSKSIKPWGPLEEEDDDHVVVTDAHDDGNAKKGNVIVSDVGASSKLVKNKEKGKSIITDASADDRNAKKSNVIVSDVGGGVKIKEKGELGTSHVPNAKKDAKKDNAVGDVAKILEGEDFEYIASKYPSLTNMLDLEMLSRMPQQLRKNAVIDTIKYMGRGKANKLEEESADLRLKELELHAKKLDLTNKQINLILEVARR